jgi:hypothetical protein
VGCQCQHDAQRRDRQRREPTRRSDLGGERWSQDLLGTTPDAPESVGRSDGAAEHRPFEAGWHHFACVSNSVPSHDGGAARVQQSASVVIAASLNRDNRPSAPDTQPPGRRASRPARLDGEQFGNPAADSAQPSRPRSQGTGAGW